MIVRDQNADVGHQIIDELGRLPGKIEELVTSTRQPARELASQFADAGGFYVLGSGPLFGLAYKLSLSVVIENLWIDAAPVDTGEFYHGPIEIIPPAGESKLRMPILHLVGTDATRTVSERAIRFCTKHSSACLRCQGLPGVRRALLTIRPLRSNRVVGHVHGGSEGSRRRRASLHGQDRFPLGGLRRCGLRASPRAAAGF